MSNGDGGAAFPCSSDRYGDAVEGMSLRDYFAAQVIAECLRISMNVSNAVTGRPETRATVMAYEVADAMLEARKR